MTSIPQAHATLHFGIEPRPEELSIYHVLTGKTRVGEVCRQVAENLWVIPSSLDLAAAELELVGVSAGRVILRDKLARGSPAGRLSADRLPAVAGHPDAQRALAAVNEVFIPLQPHFFALHGLSKLLETIDLVAARLNDALKLSGVILCMYDGGTRLATEVGQDVDAFFRKARGRATPWANAQTFQTRIRRNIRLAEAPSFGQSIFQYAPDSHGAEDYQRLAAEIVASGGGNQKG